MVPNKYLIEHDGMFFGPFDTPEDAMKYAHDRGYLPVFIAELKAP